MHLNLNIFKRILNMFKNIQNYILATIAGFVCKLYDDIYDNEKLIDYKSEFNLELLKGIHYIIFTILCLSEPLFFIIQVIINTLHNLSNKVAFAPPYEHSLLYSFLILFFIIDYKKISMTVYDLAPFFASACSLYIEPFVLKSEYSVFKLGIRLISTCNCIIASLLPFSKGITYILLYGVGYFLCSVFVQIHSLDLTSKYAQIKLKLEELFDIIK